jgi:hypothetical protein
VVKQLGERLPGIEIVQGHSAGALDAITAAVTGSEVMALNSLNVKLSSDPAGLDFGFGILESWLGQIGNCSAKIGLARDLLEVASLTSGREQQLIAAGVQEAFGIAL